jgi:signal peptide peptidase SppA
MKYAYLSRLLNEPLLAHPAKAATVAGVLLRREGIDADITEAEPLPAAVPARRLTRMFGGPAQEAALVTATGERPPFLVKDGIAVIEITGSLAHRQMSVGESSGVLGYDWISTQLQAALASSAVRGIVLDIHSAGGEVSGAFTLGDDIFAARQVKPIVALADEMAFSAGYILASAADEVWLASDTAQVGSIGVVMVHMSFEQQLKNEGVKPTIIQAGDKKADGNPFQDLPDSVASDLQSRIDAVYDIFVGRVSRWRGLSESAVAAQQAGVFMGRDAVDAGLADGIAAPRDIFNALAEFAADVQLPAQRAAIGAR